MAPASVTAAGEEDGGRGSAGRPSTQPQRPLPDAPRWHALRTLDAERRRVAGRMTATTKRGRANSPWHKGPRREPPTKPRECRRALPAYAPMEMTLGTPSFRPAARRPNKRRARAGQRSRHFPRPAETHHCDPGETCPREDPTASMASGERPLAASPEHAPHGATDLVDTCTGHASGVQ